MQRKSLVLILLLLVSLSLTGCKDDDNQDTENEVLSNIITILEAEGYVLTDHDSDTRSYHATYTLENYSITVTVVKLYQGYINSNERFVRVVLFETVEQSISYYNALVDEGEYEVYRNQDVVVISSSLETIELFD